MLRFSPRHLLFLLVFSASFFARAQDSKSYAKEASDKYNAEKYKDAVQLYTKAIEKDPQNAEYFLKRGKAYNNQGLLEKGFADMAKSLEINPEYFDAFIERASLYYIIKESDRSILDYSAAFKYAVEDSIKNFILVNRASSKLQKMDFNGAIKDCEAVLTMDSLNVGALNNMAIALDEVGSHGKAAYFLKKIISIDSTAGYAYMNVGYYLSFHGEYAESLPYFDKAIELSPEIAYSYNNRGYSKFKLNQYKEALKDINKSIKMDPSNSYAYRNRGLVYKAMGKDKKACEDWETALKRGFTKSFGTEVEKLIKENCL